MNGITANGRVDAFTVAPDGRRTQVVRGPNTLLLSCADAVARVFAGAPDYRPTTIGFVHGAESNLGVNFAFTPGDRTAHTQVELVGTGLSVYDRDIDNNRRFSSSGDGYSGNTVTLSASKPGADTPDYVYGALLKSANGHVLAVKRFDQPVMQSEGYSFMVEWNVTFN